MKKKTCNKCFETKNIDGFSKCKKNPDGFSYSCKECVKKYDKDYYSKNKKKIKRMAKEYYESNLETCKKSRKDYYLKNRERFIKQFRNYYFVHKEYALEWAKNYIATHPEIAKKSQKNFKANHPERIKMFKDRWAKGHPEKRLEYAENRRARKIANGGSISSEEWEEVKKKYGYRCLCCGRTDVKLQMDHVIPLAKGGHHGVENIQPLCKSCNSSKSTQHIDYRP